jgi:hypothetical protein
VRQGFVGAQGASRPVIEFCWSVNLTGDHDLTCNAPSQLYSRTKLAATVPHAPALGQASPLSVPFNPVLAMGRQLRPEPPVVPARLCRRYTSGGAVTVTEELTSPTTCGSTQGVMIAVT